MDSYREVNRRLQIGTTILFRDFERKTVTQNITIKEMVGQVQLILNPPLYTIVGYKRNKECFYVQNRCYKNACCQNNRT